MEQIIFYTLAGISVASAVFFVFARNPLYSILSLIMTFFSVAGLYILLNAQFLGIVQIIVYAGAILVLFLYILMMLNLNEENRGKRHFLRTIIAVFSSGLLLVGLLGMYKGLSENKLRINNLDNEIGLTKNLGKVLFSEYVLPFELASILILASIVGSVLIGKKDL